MANLTAEQIEQKKQQLKQLAEEAQQLKDELVEAGAWPMDEDDLDKVAGGGDLENLVWEFQGLPLEYGAPKFVDQVTEPPTIGRPGPIQ